MGYDTIATLCGRYHPIFGSYFGTSTREKSVYSVCFGIGGQYPVTCITASWLNFNTLEKN